MTTDTDARPLEADDLARPGAQDATARPRPEEDGTIPRALDRPGPVDDARSALRASERVLARTWRLIALRGLAALTIGVVLLVRPELGLTALVGAVGLLAIVSGLVSAAGAHALPRAARRHRLWLTGHAVVGVVGGLAVLVWPDISATALLYAVALWAIVVGVTEALAAPVLPVSGHRTVLVAVGGIALAAIGVLMFVSPGQGAIALLVLVAASALVRGASDLALAVQLRNLAGELDGSSRSFTRAASPARG